MKQLKRQARYQESEQALLEHRRKNAETKEIKGKETGHCTKFKQSQLIQRLT